MAAAETGAVAGGGDGNRGSDGGKIEIVEHWEH